MLLEVTPPDVTTTQSGGLVEWLGFNPSGLGLAAIVATIILAIIKGYLIPRGTFDAIIKAKNEEIERTKLALVTEQQRGDIQDEAIRDIVAAQTHGQHVMEAMHVTLMRLSGTQVPENYPPLQPPPATSPGGPS